MPRYFFHIWDGVELIPDEEGMLLPDTNAALVEAKLSARDFAAECIRTGKLLDGRRIAVHDSEGRPIFEYAIQDIIGDIGN
ncbi:MAG: hypothetical protein JSR25_06305 [Proteobacteria bacterium]|nr:hypothetical protein [Pseudomonadota bacterium]